MDLKPYQSHPGKLHPGMFCTTQKKRKLYKSSLLLSSLLLLTWEDSATFLAFCLPKISCVSYVSGVTLWYSFIPDCQDTFSSELLLIQPNNSQVKESNRHKLLWEKFPDVFYSTKRFLALRDLAVFFNTLMIKHC